MRTQYSYILPRQRFQMRHSFPGSVYRRPKVQRTSSFVNIIKRKMLEIPTQRVDLETGVKPSKSVEKVSRFLFLLKHLRQSAKVSGAGVRAVAPAFASPYCGSAGSTLRVKAIHTHGLSSLLILFVHPELLQRGRTGVAVVLT